MYQRKHKYENSFSFKVSSHCCFIVFATQDSFISYFYQSNSWLRMLLEPLNAQTSVTFTIPAPAAAINFRRVLRFYQIKDIIISAEFSINLPTNTKPVAYLIDTKTSANTHHYNHNPDQEVSRGFTNKNNIFSILFLQTAVTPSIYFIS